MSSSSSSSTNITLVAMMGLPASGKSSLASKLQSLSSNWQVIVMSFDEFVPLPVQLKICNQMHEDVATNKIMKTLRKKFLECVHSVIELANSNGFNNSKDSLVNYGTELESKLSSTLASEEEATKKYNEMFLRRMKVVSEMLKESILRDSNHMRLRFVIVVDDNNYYHSMRNEICQIAKRFQTGYCLINCKASLETCLERNLKRESKYQVPSSVIIEMGLKYEQPDVSCNLCDEFCMEIDTNCEDKDFPSTAEDLQQFIDKSFSNVPQEEVDRSSKIEIQKRICSENEIHQADIILRKWISEQLKSYSSGLTATDKKTLSLVFARRKKQTLELMRKGEFKIICDLMADSAEFKNELVTFFKNFGD